MQRKKPLRLQRLVYLQMQVLLVAFVPLLVVVVEEYPVAVVETLSIVWKVDQIGEGKQNSPTVVGYLHERYSPRERESEYNYRCG